MNEIGSVVSIENDRYKIVEDFENDIFADDIELIVYGDISIDMDIW